MGTSVFLYLTGRTNGIRPNSKFFGIYLNFSNTRDIEVLSAYDLLTVVTIVTYPVMQILLLYCLLFLFS